MVRLILPLLEETKDQPVCTHTLGSLYLRLPWWCLVRNVVVCEISLVIVSSLVWLLDLDWNYNSA